MSIPNSSLLEFPCDFGVKAFGKSDVAFEQTVKAIVEKHIDSALSEEAISKKISKDGSYTSMTIMIKAKDKAQLDAIYQDLTDEPLVVLAL